MSVEWLSWLAPAFLSVGCGVAYGNATARRDYGSATLWAAQICAFSSVIGLSDLRYRSWVGSALMAVSAGFWLVVTRCELRRQSSAEGGLMTKLTYEIREAGSELWHTLGILELHGEAASTDIRNGRLDLILFRCENDRSVIAAIPDPGATAAAGVLRYLAMAAGRKVLATLRSDGETFERDMVSHRGLIYRARWTHHTE